MAMTDPFLPGSDDAGADAGNTLPGDDGLAGGGEQVPGEQAPGDDAAHGPVADDQDPPIRRPDTQPSRLA